MGAIVKGSADEVPGYDRVVVMAVAVEDYQNAPGRQAITDVPFALDDAEAFVATIEQVYNGLVPVDAHRLFGNHATLATIHDHANYLISNLAPTDLFVFFYAGHGCQIEGANRLTAWDSNPEQLGLTTVDLNDAVIARVRASECTRALLFIDACAEKMKKDVFSRSLILELSDTQIAHELEGEDYVGVFLSCSDGEKSHSSKVIGHGIFTWHLLRALRGEDPRALAKGRWLTDVSLRDWLRSEIRSFITTRTNIRGTQTSRAVLNSAHTFRIRHVPEPPAVRADLADLGLTNTDVFLEGVETGMIRSLPGYDSRSHSVPKKHSGSVDAWIERLMKEGLEEELDDLLASAKKALGFGRRDGQTEWADGGGDVDTPAFRFRILVDQDPDDPARWRVRRQLELRDGWEARREEIETAIAGVDLDRFVVTFDKRRASYEEVADALEALERQGGSFDERKLERTLTYSRDDMTIVIDFVAGTVELSVRGEANLKLAESARSVSLGWTKRSPMLAATGARALPAPSDGDDG